MIEATAARVKSAQIRPLKGADSIDFTTVRMTPAGIESVDGVAIDHQFVAVTEEPGSRGFHHFLSLRTQVDPSKHLYAPGEPRLALVKPAYEELSQDFTFGWREPNTEQIAVPREYDPNLILPIQVWEHWGGAIEEPVLSEWLSDQLKRNVLVARTGVYPWTRLAKQNYLPNHNPLRAQDGYPVHITLQEDIDEMSRVSGETVPHERFRDQFTLERLPAWSLHDYSAWEVNGVEVWQPKPCDRCEVTGKDERSGELSSLKPLAAVNKLRPRWINNRGEPKQIVGENLLPQGTTLVVVGDLFIPIALREVPLTFEEPKPKKALNF